MSANQESSARSPAERLGFKPGQVVQEIGLDEDCDEELRGAVEELTGKELVDEEFEGRADVVLLWWREADGDLTNGLTDARSSLTDGGYVWLLTPKEGREGYVKPSEISDAALVAGLAQTSNLSAAVEWSGVRLTAKARR